MKSIISEHLGFGLASISSMQNKSSVNKLLNVVYENGIVHFDTAPLYGQGYSEIIIGNFIKNKRENIALSTKFGMGSTQIPNIPSWLALPLNYYKKKLIGNKCKTLNIEQKKEIQIHKVIDKKYIETHFQSSLKRLDTDYVDYYLLHEMSPECLTDNAILFLFDLKKRGLIKEIGLGTSCTAILNIKSESLLGWDILQYEFDEEKNNTIKVLYPNKTHFIHSCLKKYFGNDPLNNQINHYNVLANAAKKNMKGKILFSTRNVELLYENLKNFTNNFSS